jgi:hypothetical protein
MGAAMAGGEHAAVAVVGVLAQAEVGDQGDLVAEVAGEGLEGPLHDPLGRPCLGALGVLGRRHAEQQQRRDTQRGQLGGLLPQAVEGVLVVAWHRGDRDRLADALLDEQGSDQVAPGHLGLAGQVAQDPGAPCAARTARGKWGWLHR